MEIIGTISALSVDPITKMGSVTFMVDDLSDVLAEYQALKEKKLRINAKVYRKKRTQSMNSYFWVLCSEVAKRLKTTPDEIHTKVINERSIPVLDDNNKPVVIAMKSHINVKRLPGYWKEINQREGCTQYMMIKGTSQMDTEEMADALDDLIEDAKCLGIQTETPDEIARWKAAEEACYGKKTVVNPH